MHDSYTTHAHRNYAAMADAQRFKVIMLADLDAFYSQVEVKQHPELKGKPVGVVQ